MGNIHITLPGGKTEVWTWRAGKVYTEIRDPNRKKYAVSHPDMTGISWEDIERAKRKKYAAPCEITPALVMRHITTVIIPDRKATKTK